MADLLQQLKQLNGRTLIAGVGNPDWGDDAVGIYITDILLRDLPSVSASTKVLPLYSRPENILTLLSEEHFDNVIFIDAVEFGAIPASVILLNSDEIRSRFPQISTHKISIAILAQLIEAGGTTRVYLIGIQPQNLLPETPITPAVKKSADAIVELLKVIFSKNNNPEKSTVKTLPDYDNS